MIIRRLNPDEGIRTRKLYEEIFSEDSKAFVDYYYKRVARENRIYVAESDGQILAMLHLNPHPFFMKGNKQKDIFYIVAVATREDCRHKGLMTELLKASMQDLYQEGYSLTYLMAASERIYEPFDFITVQKRNMGTAQLDLDYANGSLNLELKALEKIDDLDQKAQELNEHFKSHYQLFVPRTKDYLNRMEEECACDQGHLFLVENEDKPLCLLRNYPVQEEEEAPFMVRIVNLQHFLENLNLKDSAKGKAQIHLVLQISDSLLEENNGYFWLESENQEICVEKLEDLSFLPIHKSKIISMTIRQFSQFAFGIINVENLVKGLEEEQGIKIASAAMEELAKIDAYGAVFFDELV